MLKPIVIESTGKNPKVILDKDNNLFKFSGRSIQEDSDKFYNPILEWIREYVEDPNPITEVIFKLEYLNSSSTRRLLKLLLELIKVEKKGKKVKIVWYYEKDDEVIFERGEEIENIIGIEVKFIEY